MGKHYQVKVAYNHPKRWLLDSMIGRDWENFFMDLLRQRELLIEPEATI